MRAPTNASPTRVRDDVITAAGTLIADGGVVALDLQSVARRTGHRAEVIERLFVDREHLVCSTAERLLRVDVLSVPRARLVTPSVDAVLERLVGAHRAYYDDDPTRHAAIARMTSASTFSWPQITPLLIQRNRRTSHLIAVHLHQLQTGPLAGGPPPENSTPLATALRDALGGIDLLEGAPGEHAYDAIVVDYGLLLRQHGEEWR